MVAVWSWTLTAQNLRTLGLRHIAGTLLVLITAGGGRVLAAVPEEAVKTELIRLERAWSAATIAKDPFASVPLDRYLDKAG